MQKYERDDSQPLLPKLEKPKLERSASIQNLINIYEPPKIVNTVEEVNNPIQVKPFILNLEKYKK